MLTSTNKSNIGNARKILSFYRLNYGLSAPYTALVDSETMLQSSKGGVYLKDAIPKLLGGDGIKLSVTDCTVRRLRNLGEDAKGSELFARRLQRISCSCSTEDESQCLKNIVERRIDLIMIVCHLTSTKVWPPHVALILLNKQNQLVFKSPSKESIEQAKQSHTKKTGVLSRADKMLVQKATEEERESKKRRRGQNFGDDSNQSKKRKKAKGPNPLSVKQSAKPKNNTDSGGDSSAKANSNTEGINQTKKRRTRGKRAKPSTRTTDANAKGDSTNSGNNEIKCDETSRTETDVDTGGNNMDTASNENARSDETSLAGGQVTSRTETDVGTGGNNMDTASNENARSDETSLVGGQVVNKENVTEKESLPIESTAAGGTVDERNDTSGGLESKGDGNAVKGDDLIEIEVKKKKKQRKNRRRPGGNKNKSEIN